MRRYLDGRKVKCQVRSGDGVISQADMFWDLLSEILRHISYMPSERPMPYTLERIRDETDDP